MGPARFRQWTSRRREAPPPATGATSAARRPLAWGPYEDLTGWARGLAIALAVGGFLALSGAFVDEDAPMGLRLAYWLPMMAIGALWGGFVARAIFPHDEIADGAAPRLWLRSILAALAMGAPFTGLVWAVTWLVFGHQISWRGLPYLFGSVFSLALAMTVLNTLVESRRQALRRLGAAEAPPRPVRFLERLPPRLRGADLHAIEAEDHYLRLHTSKGQDLILMRLGDAVDELEGLEGAQVHRSWWVARAAIADVRRGDGRAILTLKDGIEVPVSRTHSRKLRAAGWY
ncbi:LytTR family DNA-binding domain-containing protein [Phenylobacterium sp.]|uniref:LytTR family DNA-binding domain-containing protein n=1 Tax=Phenylobacterium sp. TaxID=1871053 RepID=UPI002731B39D|nr:LytTR family DNA-binding domain-containing protein [Phenylobacterium sp.]MDP1616265.1 LytTR family DNA-binding domain-containing protein [Phenylobacterium sp.]MDP1988046.1 LytTR family DNA-binding domain-containing protein [Phenylobacterium sp.]